MLWHYDILKLRCHQQTHNSAICVFILLLRSHMFRHCRHPQGADTKFSLKHTGIQNLQQTYIYFDVKLHYSQWPLLAFSVLRLFRHLCVCVRRVMSVRASRLTSHFTLRSGSILGRRGECTFFLAFTWKGLPSITSGKRCSNSSARSIVQKHKSGMDGVAESVFR